MIRKLTLGLFLASIGFSVGCGENADETDSPSFSYDATISSLNNASDSLSSAGGNLDSAASSSLSIGGEFAPFEVAPFSAETTSNALNYCSQYGRAWNSGDDSPRNPTEANYAIHMIECTARIDESTETPLGFLSQMKFIMCMLADENVDLTVAGTTSNVSVNPTQASERCNALTESNIKEDNTTYTFDVVVTDDPNAAWDKQIQLDAGGNPFYRVMMAETSTSLAIKAQGGFDAGTPGEALDIHISRGDGALLFEFTNGQDDKEGHIRLRLDGTMSGWEFSTISQVQGIRVIGGNNTASNGNSYEGATLTGTLSSLNYEAVQVSNVAGGTCEVGQQVGCNSSAGADCSNGGCITYGDPVDNTFSDNDNFADDIADITGGPLCFTSVTNALAPDRSALGSCSL